MLAPARTPGLAPVPHRSEALSIAEALAWPGGQSGRSEIDARVSISVAASARPVGSESSARPFDHLSNALTEALID
jgi:hypothetical protein